MCENGAEKATLAPVNCETNTRSPAVVSKMIWLGLHHLQEVRFNCLHLLLVFQIKPPDCVMSDAASSGVAPTAITLCNMVCMILHTVC